MIKSFTIFVYPVGFGLNRRYVATYSKYIFSGKTRMEVITDMLDMLEKRFKRQLDNN